jgi:hypothetical protein
MWGRRESMISLDMTAEEKETLREILECVLADLHMEKQRTEGREFRKLMQYRAEVIAKVITVLEVQEHAEQDESLNGSDRSLTSDGKKGGA